MPPVTALLVTQRPWQQSTTTVWLSTVRHNSTDLLYTEHSLVPRPRLFSVGEGVVSFLMCMTSVERHRKDLIDSHTQPRQQTETCPHIHIHNRAVSQHILSFCSISQFTWSSLSMTPPGIPHTVKSTAKAGQPLRLAIQAKYYSVSALRCLKPA